MLELKGLRHYAADEESSATAQRILHVTNSLDPQHDWESVCKQHPKA